MIEIDLVRFISILEVQATAEASTEEVTEEVEEKVVAEEKHFFPHYICQFLTLCGGTMIKTCLLGNMTPKNLILCAPISVLVPL